MSKSILELPLEIERVSRSNLIPALEAVRGCLKTTSMLWMHALAIPVLNGVVVGDWSGTSAKAVRRFATKNGFSELLLRIDKRHERWTRRRGGYLIQLPQLPATIKELKREGMIAALLEPASPYADQHSLAAATFPDLSKIVVEVVGPGFDASDLLRADNQAHERWEAMLSFAAPLRSDEPIRFRRIHLIDVHDYVRSVQARLTKIGARRKNPAFPDAILKDPRSDAAVLAQEGLSFLKEINQTALLKHAEAYQAIPERHLVSFVRRIRNLLAGLAAYGIHLGPSSFAASVLPRRGLVFWDFFPARKQEAAALYPAA